MPSKGTVFRWLATMPEFQDQYARAREAQAETHADDMMEIADDARNDWMKAADEEGGLGYKLNGEHIQRSKLRIDTRKWIASKLKPKKYGDKIEHTGPEGGPLQINLVRFSDPE